MANKLEKEEAFPLPAEFLTFDDNNFKKQRDTSEFTFPSEFPFEFDQNANDSARLTELTRNSKLNHPPHPFPSYKSYELQKRRLGFEGSPPLTVAHFGRSSSQPPTRPWSQVGKLVQHHPPPPCRNSGFSNAFAERVREEQLLKQQQRCVWSNTQAQNSNSWNFEKQTRVGRSAIGAFGENEQVAWRSLQCMRQQNQENRAISRDSFVNAGSGNQFSGGVKKQRSGTGVFLPRNYGTNNHSNTNKSGCLTTPILDKGVPGLYSNFSVMDSGVVQPLGQTRFLDRFDSEYDIELAKMKLLLMQRRQHIQPGSIPLRETY